jgi:hypothetical protein
VYITYSRTLLSYKKKNEILSFVGKLTGMENIMLSELNQVQKDKSCMFSLICGRQLQIYTHTHICVCVSIYMTFPKVGLLEETKEGGKKEKIDRE